MSLTKLILTSIVCLCLSTLASAQSLDLVQALNLGTIAVIDNSTPSTVKITKEGLSRSTGGIHFIETGQPAILEATGFDANRRLYIDVTVVQSGTVTKLVSNEQFTVVEYDYLEFIQTDAQGFAEIFVGATFESSGSGSENFRDTDFTADFSVTVNY